MGVSTDGEISFGYPCDDDTNLPWDDENYDGDIDEWWHAVAGGEDHKIPVELVNYCGIEYPMYAVTVPGIGASCSRGSPQVFDPAKLVATDEQIESLKAFLDKYEIEYSGEPQWLLTSYWG